MKFQAGAVSRAFTQPMQRRLKLWHAQSADCGRAAGELWQIHLPLITMVGLTLIGLYDCTAVRQGASADAQPALPAWQAAQTPSMAWGEALTGATAGTDASATPVATTDSPDSAKDLLHRRSRQTAGLDNGSTAVPATRTIAPASRPFSLTLQDMLTGLTATAPPIG